MLASIREDAARLAPERRHRIDLDADEDLWLYGNDAELRSAFSNVVFNAVRYTPANGSIHITWQGEDGGARLDVVDDGIGIAAHHIPRLSERFYRVDVSRSRESGGTGLGLAIVKHVLSRHGGHLEIQSELGKGSRFSCIFPAAAVKRHESTMEPEPA
jgi:two-component system phosphate regulon sensor histidine kinase PhoR